MSELPAAEVIRQLQPMNAFYRQLGGKLASPFMSLSFISLPTVPEFGLTDMGLIDVRRHCVISSFID
jgi:adenine deaminase